MKKIYTVIFRAEPEGGFTVMVPSLPGCITYGKTLEEARKNVDEAVSLYLEDLDEGNELIPSDEMNFIGSVEFDSLKKVKV